VGDDWRREEVEAAVADYFDMLALELRGMPYNKAEHNRALQRVVPARTRGSIERKHQNISAVLIECGYPYIDGYKPLANYQELLRTVIAERLVGATTLNTTVAQAVEQPGSDQSIDDLLAIQVEPPRREEERRVREQPAAAPPRVRRNYLEIEARNQSLGKAGEELVLRFERERLRHFGQPRLAANIRHVSQTEGDHLGYDILSFDPDGRERLIEVKTTRFGALTPFFASRNEVEVSRQRQEQYQVYRVFRFSADAKLFALPGSLQKTCVLEPFTFSALPR
jgi:hypothetical protein